LGPCPGAVVAPGAAIHRGGPVAPVERGPAPRVTGPARVCGRDVSPAARRRLRRVLRSAPVVAHERVAQRPPKGDVENGVGDAVDPEVPDRLGPPLAAGP